MEQQAREQAFITALVTEHFVLQSARSATIGEANGRASVYLGTVSSALVAFGFLAQVATRLDPFVAAVLPACSSWASSPTSGWSTTVSRASGVAADPADPRLLPQPDARRRAVLRGPTARGQMAAAVATPGRG